LDLAVGTVVGVEPIVELELVFLLDYFSKILFYLPPVVLFIANNGSKPIIEVNGEFSCISFRMSSNLFDYFHFDCNLC
jgi:hypothetical protein